MVPKHNFIGPFKLFFLIGHGYQKFLEKTHLELLFLKPFTIPKFFSLKYFQKDNEQNSAPYSKTALPIGLFLRSSNHGTQKINCLEDKDIIKIILIL
jgi:hypothetical protein